MVCINNYLYFVSDLERSGNMKKKKSILFLFTVLSTLLVSGTTAYADGDALGVSTGDGRIYATLGVFGAAIIIAVLMILFRKRDKD